MHLLSKLTAIGLICLAPFGVRAEFEAGDRIAPQRVELLDGSTLSPAQLAGKPAAYLFWATWCPICRSELPGYQKLHAAHVGKGFRVIAVSLDESDGVVRDFLRQHPYTFPVAMRSDALRQAFGPIQGTPTLFIVDRDGRIARKQLGGVDFDALDALIRSLL